MITITPRSRDPAGTERGPSLDLVALALALEEGEEPVTQLRLAQGDLGRRGDGVFGDLLDLSHRTQAET